MADEISIPWKWDTVEFEATFDEYLKVSSRDLATAINTKLFYIARRALRETPVTARERIEAELDTLVRATRHTGRQKGSTGLVKRGVAIVQKRAGKLFAGRRQVHRNFVGKRLLRALNGPTTAQRVRKLRGSRVRSRAYLKSGWLGAIKDLEPLAEKKQAPDLGERPKKFGKYKGQAAPAVALTPGGPISGLIANTIGALGKRMFKQQAALRKYGRPALQRAINAETASMREYLEEKARTAARRANIQSRG